MTSPSRSPSPTTNGSASLSRLHSRRFGRGHSPYLATQDNPRSRYVTIMYHAAAFADPVPYGESQLRSDMAAVRANARASREAIVNMPRSPRPLGLIAEDSQEPSQPGVSKRTRKAGAHQTTQTQVLNGKPGVGIDHRAGSLVDKIAPNISNVTMYASEPRHGATAVNASLAAAIALPVQAADTLRGLLGKSWMMDSPSVAKRGEAIQPAVDANGTMRRGGINLRGGLEFGSRGASRAALA